MMQATDVLPPNAIVCVAPLSRERKANSYFFGFSLPFTISFLTNENIFDTQQITMPILSDKILLSNNNILEQANLLNLANDIFADSIPLGGLFRDLMDDALYATSKKTSTIKGMK
jgi:hypothetical protein